jgi:TM2 domain-containing membrane protein YozV/ribosomal protein L40E
VTTGKEDSTSSGASESAESTSLRTTKHCLNCGSVIDINAAICPKCGVSQNKRPAGKSKIFCHNCGAEIDINAEICPKCGVRQRVSAPIAAGEKSPFIAAILSFLIAGVGEMYVGKMRRGIVILLAAAILAAISMGIGYFVIWLLSIYDAYKLAKGEPSPLDFIDQYVDNL